MFDLVNFERTNNIGLTIWSKKIFVATLDLRNVSRHCKG